MYLNITLIFTWEIGPCMASLKLSVYLSYSCSFADTFQVQLWTLGSSTDGFFPTQNLTFLAVLKTIHRTSMVGSIAKLSVQVLFIKVLPINIFPTVSSCAKMIHRTAK